MKTKSMTSPTSLNGK